MNESHSFSLAQAQVNARLYRLVKVTGGGEAKGAGIRDEVMRNEEDALRNISCTK